MTLNAVAIVLAVAGSAIALWFDLQRRGLRLSRISRWNMFTTCDVASVVLTVGLATFTLAASPIMRAPVPRLLTPAATCVLASAILTLFLWNEGLRQVQLQRPGGIVFAEWGILCGGGGGGCILLWFGYLRLTSFTVFLKNPQAVLCCLLVSAGAFILSLILPPFLRGQEEHRILDQLATSGEFTQLEYVAATAECAFPSKWRMLDTQSAELEVLDFLKSLVQTTKPEFILETGTFIGHSAIKMAEGLRKNGSGRLLTVEYDKAVFDKAYENIQASGLSKWIDARHGSSLNLLVDDKIDLLFSDSDLSIWEAEVRRFLPQLKPRGLILIHDASSHFHVVREAALRLEEEGLLSVVLLSTPSGLVVAQKREDRT